MIFGSLSDHVAPAGQLFKAASGYPDPVSQCADDAAARRPMLRAEGGLHSVPTLGTATVAAVRTFERGSAVTVLARRGALEIQAGYVSAPESGAPRPASSVLAADVGFVRRAFTDLGA